ncbi:oxidoreductase [Pseudonocardiaceae bacterium YIM PH 21723]|nr:oxidoreductase [Pseudonocardiaceae bacterium YIM PH 21723]
MKAIRQYEFGAADTLRYEDAPDPRPGPGQVRIAVRASGVHLIDTAIRRGAVPPTLPLPALPMTPGREVAGVVDALGAEVDPGWLGASVIAHLGFQHSGGYAELAVADVAALHRKPDRLDFPQAVAMMGTGRMTMNVLNRARITEQDVVLVTSAAGGMGSLLVQAARYERALAIGVAGGPEKKQLVKDLGADFAIDYKAEEIPAEPAPTIVLDAVGGSVGRAAFERLAPGGRHLIYGWTAGSPTEFTSAEMFQRGLSVEYVLGGGIPPAALLREWEEQAMAFAASGRVTPVVTLVPLSEAAEAHRALENGQVVGKLVLTC